MVSHNKCERLSAGLGVLALIAFTARDTSAQTLAEIVSLLDLEPLVPEGGYYRETFRDPGVIQQTCLPAAFRGARNFSTEILFALSTTNISALHRLTSAETWHFYLGRPLLISEIQPDGSLKETLLGNDLLAGQTPQYVVQPGSWFGASVGEPDDQGLLADLQQAYEFALVGNSVAPGYDNADFELGNRSELLQQYPEHASTIDLLVPDS